MLFGLFFWCAHFYMVFAGCLDTFKKTVLSPIPFFWKLAKRSQKPCFNWNVGIFTWYFIAWGYNVCIFTWRIQPPGFRAKPGGWNVCIYMENPTPKRTPQAQTPPKEDPPSPRSPRDPTTPDAREMPQKRPRAAPEEQPKLPESMLYTPPLDIIV